MIGWKNWNFGVGWKPKTKQEIAGMINFFQGIYKVLANGSGGLYAGLQPVFFLAIFVFAHSFYFGLK